MKKLMFAAAALVAGLCMADVTSANIVGYVNSPKEGYSFAGFCFPQVGGNEALTYGDLKVNCSEDGSASDEGWAMMMDSIVVLDGGSYVMDIVYVPEWAAEIYGEIAKGWYELDVYEDGADYNSEPLPFGQAVEVCIVDDVGAEIAFAGEVKDAPTVTDVAGYMGIANCAPKKIYAEDIIVNCSEDGSASDEGWAMMMDSIVVLDGGSYVMDIVYVPEWAAEIYGEIAKGWYELDVYEDGADYNHTEDLCWNAGEGFEICVVDDLGATVTIKSAVAAKDAK